MHLGWFRSTFWPAAILALSLPGAPAPVLPPASLAAPAGILVAGFRKGSCAAAAGVMPGDLLLSWYSPADGGGCEAGAGGDLLSPFDLDEVEREHVPRGPIELTLDRGGEPLQVVIPAQGLGLRLLPRLPEVDRACLTEGRILANSGSLSDAATRWREAARSAMGRGDPLTASWLFFEAGALAGEAKDWEGALADYGLARESARKAGHAYAETVILGAEGLALRKLKRPAEADASYRRALAICDGAPGMGLSGAGILLSMSNAAQEQGDTEAAEALLRESMVRLDAIAPGGLQVADTRINLGILVAKRSDLDAADRLYREAIAIRERLAPGSVQLAYALNNLGIIARQRGELEACEEFYGRCLKIFEGLGTRGAALISIWNNLGTVALHRGNLVRSQECFKKALALLDEAPSATQRATVLQNLGNIARMRGELDAAADFYEKALAMKQETGADGISVASTLGNLGVVADERLDFRGAAEFYQRALELQEVAAPGGLAVACTLNNLGQVSLDEGDKDAAEAYFRRSLAIKERIAPGSLEEAITLKGLAEIAVQRSDLTGAEVLLKRCLAIRQRLAPGTAEEADALGHLGILAEIRGEPGAALEYFTRAVESLETQRGQLGGGAEASQTFSATHADLYRNLVRLQILEGLEKEAFFTLERFRARTLLDLLAERDLDFSKDAPADILREQKRVDHDYGILQDRLAALNPEKDEAEIREVVSRLRDMRARQVEVTEKIRRASPKLAHLEYPRPLDFGGAVRALPKGSLLLSYCVGSKGTLLFTLFDGKLRVEEIPVERKTLARKVRLLRETLRDPAQAELSDTAAAELYALLVGPVQDLLGKARGVLLCPDGPLHALPFAALRDGRGGFLAERAALSTILSVTLLSELASGEKNSRPPRLAAFGDPTMPEGGTSIRGVDLKPLPGTRKEVESLRELFPSGATVWLGTQATAERALHVGDEPTLIHFACHGLVDERRPLDSALVLSPPATGGGGRESGLLQAWEIFESMRIRADLVTLSACETGLGTEKGGEGLVGLTRAFQYAGARSVLSSLWEVSDEATSQMMRSFYGHLRRGKSKPEALRLAQIEMIGTGKGYSTGDRESGADRGGSPAEISPGPPAGGATPPSSPGAGASPPSSVLPPPRPDFSHPFFWAGFVLNGPEL